MRNVTSIFGIPAGIGSIPESSKRARERQSLASSRSPWTTCRSTMVCPSTDVVNISRALVGIVVLRGISTLTMPPSVSIPSDSGVTSRSSMLVIPPARICAWTAAPSATTSSGLSWLCGVLPNSSRTRRRRSGTRVEPPTRTTSSMSDEPRLASASATRHGPSVESTSFPISSSSSVRAISRWAVNPSNGVEAGDPSRVLRRLALAVVEIGGDSDDGLLDRLPEVLLGALLERFQHDRRHLRRRHLPVLHLDLHDPVARGDFEREVAELLLDVLVPSPHEPLD